MARLISTDILHKGWSTLYRAIIELDDGVRLAREVEDHGAAVAVLPYDPQGRTALLVRQLRNGPLVAGADAPRLLEAPAGLIDPGEDAATAGRREVLEEVGALIRELEPLGVTFSCPGVSTERISLYLGQYGQADRVAEGGGLASEHENIEVVELPLAELARLADAGELADLKTLTLTLHLRLRRPDLFEAAP
nr:NUDIX hydrolase [uncultured Brevundimonas sp.]